MQPSTYFTSQRDLSELLKLILDPQTRGLEIAWFFKF